jgi:hypothetical protein
MEHALSRNVTEFGCFYRVESVFTGAKAGEHEPPRASRA